MRASDHTIQVIVDRPRSLRHEGAVCISLLYEGARIYSAMFLLENEACGNRMIIGGFQGSNSTDAKETYVKLTRAFFGMRPRDLLVNIIKIVSASVGCKTIRGITSEYHRSKHALVRTLYHGDLPYDEIWTDHGGKPDGEGFIEFPAQIRLRSACEIPPNKRSQYRRRYELLDELQEEISRVFALHQRSLVRYDWMGLGE